MLVFSNEACPLPLINLVQALSADSPLRDCAAVSHVPTELPDVAAPVTPMVTVLRCNRYDGSGSSCSSAPT